MEADGRRQLAGLSGSRMGKRTCGNAVEKHTSALCESLIPVAGIDGMGVRLKKCLHSRALNLYETSLDLAALDRGRT